MYCKIATVILKKRDNSSPCLTAWVVLLCACIQQVFYLLLPEGNVCSQKHTDSKTFILGRILKIAGSRALYYLLQSHFISPLSKYLTGLFIHGKGSK
jgi:hypothetical protein